MHKLKLTYVLLLVGSITVVIALIVFPVRWTQAAQQTPGTMPNMVKPVATVDGATYPELIPDAEAYKLLFLSLSLTPDESNDANAVEQRLTFVRQTGVSPDEVPRIITIMDGFRARYETLSANYNRKAMDQASQGITADPTKFDNDLTGLVSMTRLALQGALSTQSLQNFHAHVQGLKRHIKMSQ